MICVGHSHMVCLLHAARDAGLPYQAISLKSFGKRRDAAARVIVDRGKPDFADATKALLTEGAEPVLSFVGGIHYVQMGLWPLNNPSAPAFDFALPQAPHRPVSAEATHIPFDTMREQITWTYRARMKLLDRLASLAPGRVVHFAPPPPVSDRWLGQALRERNVEFVQLPDARVRWRLWRLTADLFRERAEAHGVRFVDAPEASMDEDGFLRDELVRNVTHGNTAFGALLLERFREVA